MNNLDVASFYEAIRLFQSGQVDYLIPAEILELAKRFETAGHYDAARILRSILNNRWSLA